MDLEFHWINILILIGAFNALIFCIILVFQKRHPGSGFLVAFVFVFAYNGFETFNWSSGLDQRYIFFDLFSFIVIYAVGPSLYLYTRSLLNPEGKASAGTVVLHYGIVIFQFVTRVAIIFYHMLWINKIITVEVHPMQLMEIVWSYSEPLSVIVFLGYLALSIFQLRKHKRSLSQRVRDKQRVTLKWITSLLWCLTIFGIAWVLTVISPYLLNVPFDVHYYPIELGLVLFTYWIVFNGYHKVKLLSARPPAAFLHTIADIDPEGVISRLRSVMEVEKLYLDPELKLTKLAAHTGIPVKTISTTLNRYQNISFNEFVNGYRVKEVSERMMNPANRHFTISALALEAGFNSQATFQRVFKNATGMRPREYLVHWKRTG